MHKYFNDLYEEIGEDKALVMELADDFISIYEEHIDQLKDAISQEDFTNISFIAHKFKGSSLNFSIPKFTAIAKDLEEQGKNEENNNLNELINALNIEFKSFVNAKNNI